MEDWLSENIPLRNVGYTAGKAVSLTSDLQILQPSKYSTREIILFSPTSFDPTIIMNVVPYAVPKSVWVLHYKTKPILVI